MHRNHNSVALALRIRADITNDELRPKDICSNRTDENVFPNDRDKIEARAPRTAVVSFPLSDVSGTSVLQIDDSILVSQ